MGQIKGWYLQPWFINIYDINRLLLPGVNFTFHMSSAYIKTVQGAKSFLLKEAHLTVMSKTNSGAVFLGRLQTGTQSQGTNPDVKGETQLPTTFIPLASTDFLHNYSHAMSTLNPLLGLNTP